MNTEEQEILDNLKLAVTERSADESFVHHKWCIMCLYWYENPGKSIEELMAANIRKLSVDWDKKITLPEVREAFLKYYTFNLQVAGELPKKS